MGRELVHGAVFQGGRKVVPGLHYPEGEKTLRELIVPDGGRLQFWAQRVISSKGPALGDARHGVEISGTAETPFEEHQVGVLQVHGHRHHLLFEWRRRVAAVDEVEAPSVHSLELFDVGWGGWVPGGEAKGHQRLDEGLVRQPFDPGGAPLEVAAHKAQPLRGLGAHGVGVHAPAQVAGQVDAEESLAVDVLEGGAFDGVLKVQGGVGVGDIHDLALFWIEGHAVVVAPDLDVVQVRLSIIIIMSIIIQKKILVPSEPSNTKIAVNF